MASPTKRLKVRRALSISSKGKRRKNLARRVGSTAPNLPLNKPNANELAQQKQKA